MPAAGRAMRRPKRVREAPVRAVGASDGRNACSCTPALTRTDRRAILAGLPILPGLAALIGWNAGSRFAPGRMLAGGLLALPALVAGMAGPVGAAATASMARARRRRRAASGGRERGLRPLQPGGASRDWKEPAMTGLEAQGLTLAQDRRGVEGQTLVLPAGRVTAILGPNGCGRSRLHEGPAKRIAREGMERGARPGLPAWRHPAAGVASSSGTRIGRAGAGQMAGGSVAAPVPSALGQVDAAGREGLASAQAANKVPRCRERVALHAAPRPGRAQVSGTEGSPP